MTPEQRDAICGEKIRYTSKIDAVKATYFGKGRTRNRAYRCAACGWWHIGHKNRHDKTVDVLKSSLSALRRA